MIKKVRIGNKYLTTKKKGGARKKNKNIKKTKICNSQFGGSKDKFEITTLSNIDPSKFSIAKYVNANIDWGIMPGPPPTNCSIM